MESQPTVQATGGCEAEKEPAGQNSIEDHFGLSYHSRKDREITQVFRVSLLLFRAPGTVTGRGIGFRVREPARTRQAGLQGSFKSVYVINSDHPRWQRELY